MKRLIEKMKICVLAVAILCCGCGTQNDETPMNEAESIIEQPTENIVGSNAQEQTLGADQEKAKNNQQGSRQMGDNDMEKVNRELSTEELQQFMDYLNRWDNYGFLLSEYMNPECADLDQIFYNGAGISMEELTAEEQAAYEELQGEIFTDVIRLTTAQINEFLKSKTGITLADMESEFEGTYLEEFDCYVWQCGDTNYTSFTCTSGRELEEGVFEIHCAADNEYVSDCVIKLKAEDDGYHVLSNLFEENNEDRMAVRRITEQSFDIELKDWGEVQFAAYEPNYHVNPREDVRFALVKNGERVYEFPAVYWNNELSELQFKEIGAVAFKDYDKDGYSDIIIIIEYESMPETGESQYIRQARVYKGGKDTFIYMEHLSWSLNCIDNNETIAGILEQIALEPLDLSGMDEKVRSQLELFVKNRNQWLSVEWEPERGQFAIQDLDKDGRLELIVWTTGGTGFYSDNFFYQMSEDGLSMTEIAQAEKQPNNLVWDLGVEGDDMKVYADTSGRRYYMVTDITRNGAWGSYMEDGCFYLENGKIYDVSIRGYSTNYLEESDTWEETYLDANGNEISEEQWEQLLADFAGDKTEVDESLKWSEMTYSEAVVSSDEALMRMLAETVKY